VAIVCAAAVEASRSAVRQILRLQVDNIKFVSPYRRDGELSC
jgi:acyl-CoA hydrolase